MLLLVSISNVPLLLLLLTSGSSLLAANTIAMSAEESGSDPHHLLLCLQIRKDEILVLVVQVQLFVDDCSMNRRSKIGESDEVPLKPVHERRTVGVVVVKFSV